MGQDYFHEGLGVSWEEGQEGVRFSIKTSVLRGTVTWICPQLTMPWTHKTQSTDERRFFSGDLERLWVQEQPPFGHQVISPGEGRQEKGNNLSLQAQTSCGLSLQAPDAIAPFWWLQDSRAFLMWWWKWHTGRVAALWAHGCSWAPT